MALVVSNSPIATTTTAPISSLSAALKEFEATLDGAQKSRYNAISVKPDASSVIAFVGKLDETAHGRNRTGVSSRLVTFLDSLRQFTDIVGTFVSSHPTVAALVWGGVQTTILAASNISAFFGRVTSMIMEVGKFCPVYSSFGHLFPDSTELQSALCEYYAAIIRLCTKIITVLRRSAVSHALSSIVSPFESEFADNITQLREHAELIKLQTTYAANKAAVQAERLAAEERKSNKMLRINIKKEQTEAREWRLQQSRRQMSQLRDIIRNELSTLASLKAYRRVLQQRVLGTSSWILNDDEFCKWRDDKENVVLWCSGKMGSGKTVLMSSIVEHLHMLRPLTGIVSHHFCFSDYAATLEARNIMGSIARQLLEDWLQKRSLDQLRTLQRELDDATTEDITRIIADGLSADQSYYIILDGIDECESKEVREVVLCLSKLSRKHPKIKIVVASRPEVGEVLRRGLVVVKYHIQGLELKTRADMRCYIDATLDQRLEDKVLMLHQPSIILNITDKLERESEGM